jgi:hypothetical protein
VLIVESIRDSEKLGLKHFQLYNCRCSTVVFIVLFPLDGQTMYKEICVASKKNYFSLNLTLLFCTYLLFGVLYFLN